MSNSKIDAFIQLFISNPNKNYTLQQLAVLFSLSERTIRQYIATINKTRNYTIKKKENGFYAITFDDVDNSESYDLLADLSPKQRQVYLINLLLFHKTVDYYSVSENLNISLPTIEKDIIQLRSWLRNYDIKLIKSDFNLYLQGEEVSLRSLSSDIIHNETQSKILDLQAISDYMKNVDVEKINKIVIESLKSNSLYLNGYTYNSLLLHLAIAIERIGLNQELQRSIIPLHQIKENEEFQVALNIAQNLEREFGLHFNIHEIVGIAILISNVTTQNDVLNEDNSIHSYIDTVTLNLTKDIMKKAEKYYYLPKIDDEFIIKISIHIDNLLYRARLNQQIHNTLTPSIKQSFPYIYDISVFIANEISLKLDVSISEDEITFIALHLGAYFERSSLNENTLKCIVVFPQYHDYHKDFIYKINKRFSDVFEIVDFVLNLNDFTESLVNDHEIDLVISTVRLDKFQNYILVSPFLTKFDIDLINDHVYSMLNTHTNIPLKLILESMFCKDGFIKNVYLNDEFEYINFLGEKLIENNRIDQQTLERIIEREKLSSTSFSNNLAIPHTIEVEGNQSSIAVIINEKPIVWGNNPIFIILMLVMGTNQKEEFRQILNYLIEYFSDESKIFNLIKADNYREFLDMLFDSNS